MLANARYPSVCLWLVSCAAPHSTATSTGVLSLAIDNASITEAQSANVTFKSSVAGAFIISSDTLGSDVWIVARGDASAGIAQTVTIPPAHLTLGANTISLAVLPAGGGALHATTELSLMPACTNAVCAGTGTGVTVNAATASPNPVTGTTAILSVSGASDTASALLYTWVATSAPQPVLFSVNGTAAAKATVATFSVSGDYVLDVVVSDGHGNSAATELDVTVAQTPTTFAVSPLTASTAIRGTESFALTVHDQFATLMTVPDVSWSVDGGGTISDAGVFTAGSTPGGPFTVTASAAGLTSTAAETVTPLEIGVTAILSTTDGNNGAWMIAQSAPLDIAATIASLSLYVVSPAGKVRLALYDASGPSGAPGTLLAQTAELTPVTGWNLADVLTPVSLAVGTYWLAYFPSDNGLQTERADHTGHAYFYQTAYGALPTTFSTTATASDTLWSVFATFQ